MRIGDRRYRINVQVIHEKDGKRRTSSPEVSFDEEYDSDWSTDFSDSNSTSETEGEVYVLEVLLQILTSRAGNRVEPCREKEIFSKVQFGPLLSSQEKNTLEDLIREYAHLFVTCHRDLPSITLEEHHIDLVDRARPVRVRQRRLAPEKVGILKNEIDKLLEGGFIIQVKNADWISPVVIVPKKEESGGYVLITRL